MKDTHIYAFENLNIRRAPEICRNTEFRVFYANAWAIIDSQERFIEQ